MPISYHVLVIKLQQMTIGLGFVCMHVWIIVGLKYLFRMC
jgi:hypothetical protein